jgi:hypothetical protein
VIGEDPRFLTHEADFVVLPAPFMVLRLYSPVLPFSQISLKINFTQHDCMK